MSAVGVGTAADTVGIDRGTLRRWRWRRDHGLALPDAVARGRCQSRRGREARPPVSSASLRAWWVSTRCGGAAPGSPAARRRGSRRRRAKRWSASAGRRRPTWRSRLRAWCAVSIPCTSDQPDISSWPRDGAVPYRTSWTLCPVTTARPWRGCSTDDFARNGAPLVVRFDRAKQHDVAAVQQVLAKYGVLGLHGPARLARYYGQLERQNRDHRSWLRDADRPAAEVIDPMMASLNNSWRRRRLGWSTGAECWRRRPVLSVDRVQMRQQVEETCRHLVAR